MKIFTILCSPSLSHWAENESISGGREINLSTGNPNLLPRRRRRSRTKDSLLIPWPSSATPRDANYSANVSANQWKVNWWDSLDLYRGHCGTRSPVKGPVYRNGWFVDMEIDRESGGNILAIRVTRHPPRPAYHGHSWMVREMRNQRMGNGTNSGFLQIDWAWIVELHSADSAEVTATLFIPPLLFRGFTIPMNSSRVFY